jgi:hypothetical protein
MINQAEGLFCIIDVIIFLQLPPPVLDNFGRVMSEPPPDKWEARTGLALAVGKISPIVPEDQISPLFSFFVDKGLRDRNEDVRKHMLGAAVAAVEDHGKVSEFAVVLSMYYCSFPKEGVVQTL